MSVVSCRSCRLRFEAEAPVELCPACEGVTQRERATQRERIPVSPPSLVPGMADIEGPLVPDPRPFRPQPFPDERPHGEGEEDWTPLEPIFVDWEEPVPPRSGRPMLLMTGAALTVALMIGFVATLREPITRLIPAAAPVYAGVAGLVTGTDAVTTASVPAGGPGKAAPSISTKGLAIRNVSTQMRVTDAGEQLVVRGEIHNRTPADTALPPLTVTIRDGRGQARYRWQVEPGKRLKAGAVHAFTARSETVPEDAASVKVDFGK